jgi:hypothetical protein
MKHTSIILGIALLAIPLAMAGPNAQTGMQNGGYWSQSTAVTVQGGSTFVLAGIAGDHDIVFLNAAGYAVGYGYNCGADYGTVPASATHALIKIWSATGGAVPLCLADVPGPSNWVYVDGL